MVKPIAPAETVKPPSPLLEKGDYLRQRFESLHAITRIVASAGMRPSRVAFFGAGAEQNYIRATLRPAGTFQGDVERKQNFVEGCHCSKPTLAARHRAGDLARDVGFRASKALRIGGRDVDRDVCRLPRAAHGNA